MAVHSWKRSWAREAEESDRVGYLGRVDPLVGLVKDDVGGLVEPTKSPLHKNQKKKNRADSVAGRQGNQLTE